MNALNLPAFTILDTQQDDLDLHFTLETVSKPSFVFVAAPRMAIWLAMAVICSFSWILRCMVNESGCISTGDECFAEITRQPSSSLFLICMKITMPQKDP